MAGGNSISAKDLIKQGISGGAPNYNTSYYSPSVKPSTSNPTPTQINRMDNMKIAQQTNTPYKSSSDRFYNNYYEKNPIVTKPVGGDDGGGNVQTPSFDYSGIVEALAKMNQDKYNSLRDALMANRQRADDTANMNYQRNLRQWKKTYNGNAGRLNGAGLSNKFNLMASRDSNIRQNETDYMNNLATLQSGRYDDASSLVRGLSNPDQNTINALLKYYI